MNTNGQSSTEHKYKLLIKTKGAILILYVHSEFKFIKTYQSLVSQKGNTNGNFP